MKNMTYTRINNMDIEKTLYFGATEEEITRYCIVENLSFGVKRHHYVNFEMFKFARKLIKKGERKKWAIRRFINSFYD